MKRKAVTKFEREVLEILLVELRRAMRIKGQLSITIDPWLSPPGGGAFVFATPNTEGRTYSITSARRRGR